MRRLLYVALVFAIPFFAWFLMVVVAHWRYDCPPPGEWGVRASFATKTRFDGQQLAVVLVRAPATSATFDADFFLSEVTLEIDRKYGRRTGEGEQGDDGEPPSASVTTIGGLHVIEFVGIVRSTDGVRSVDFGEYGVFEETDGRLSLFAGIGEKGLCVQEGNMYWSVPFMFFWR